jgi:hypothetical protein
LTNASGELDFVTDQLDEDDLRNKGSLMGNFGISFLEIIRITPHVIQKPKK